MLWDIKELPSSSPTEFVRRFLVARDGEESPSSSSSGERAVFLDPASAASVPV
jgi:hypothetical protein